MLVGEIRATRRSPEENDVLVGRWRKIDQRPLEARLPDEMEFHEDGQFRAWELGTNAPTIGQYERFASDFVRLSTALDEALKFEFWVWRGRLTLIDYDGVQGKYERVH